MILTKENMVIGEYVARISDGNFSDVIQVISKQESGLTISTDAYFKYQNGNRTFTRTLHDRSITYVKSKLINILYGADCE